MSTSAQISCGTAKVSLRWDAVATAAKITNLNRNNQLFAEFAAEAESSTQHASDRFSCVLQRAIENDHENKNVPLRNCLKELASRLPQWKLEEENHVRFFNCVLETLRTKSKEQIDAFHDSHAGMGRLFQIERPIPESQNWENTLLFLFLSEVASMVWYRSFYRSVDDAQIKDALFYLHLDEVQHFLMFRSFCLQIAKLHPGFHTEAVRVSAYFAYSLRPRKTRANAENLNGKDLNWWEHSVTEQHANRAQVFQRIRGIQKRCLREIEMAAQKRGVICTD